MGDVTRVLERVQQGDSKSAEELLSLLDDELRSLAAAKMAREAPRHTLQATALVHEAWLIGMLINTSDLNSFVHPKDILRQTATSVHWRFFCNLGDLRCDSPAPIGPTVLTNSFFLRFS